MQTKFPSLLRSPGTLLCTTAAILGCSFGAARAQSVLSVANPPTVTVAPGGAFTFTLDVTSNNTSLTGLDYNLLASQAELFQITARNLASSAFNNPITADNALFINGAALSLSPGESQDLGAFSNATQTAPLNALFVATYTVRALTSAMPGSYTLGTSNESASDDQFNTVSMTGASLTINVVPEPQTIHLLMVGTVMLVVSLYRRLGTRIAR